MPLLCPILYPHLLINPGIEAVTIVNLQINYHRVTSNSAEKHIMKRMLKSQCCVKYVC